MTPRSLISHLQDLPESLMDTDLEFVISVQSLNDDDTGKVYTAREDCYIGGIAFNEDRKEVLLMTAETLDALLNVIDCETF